jgi:hypothetical protein
METRTLIDEAANVCKGRSALARKIGCTPQQVTDWAGGKSVPLKHRLALCKVLGMSADETLAHLSEVAGAQAPKSRLTRAVSTHAAALFTVGGAVLIAWLRGDLPTMYRRATAANSASRNRQRAICKPIFPLARGLKEAF